MKKTFFKDISIFLWTLIILVNTYKFTLINSGFLTEPDERRYLMSWRLLKKLVQGDFNTAIASIFSADARPGSVILHTIPATFQFMYAKLFGFELLESQNFAPVFIYNFIISLIIYYFLYRILNLLYHNKTIALFGILFFSVLVNNFSYLRHIYPYNEALLIFLALTYWILKSYINHANVTRKQAYLWGCMAFSGILIYPAYYLNFIAVYLLFNVILKLRKIKLNQIIILNFAYFLGSLSLFFVFELLSRLSARSYINNALQLSETVTQGSFSESYSFLVKYLWQVEKWTGLLLLTGFALSIITIPRSIIHKKNKLIIILFTSFLIPYLYYTSSGYFAHQAVMYGRILHQFIIPLIIISLLALNLLPKTLQNIIIFILSLLISLQFYLQINNYLKITYPRDVYWQYLKTYPFDRIQQISEYSNSWSILPQKLDSIYIDKNKSKTINIINGQYFYPVDQYKKYQKFMPAALQKLIFKKPHFINYKAYQFEGYDIKARKILDSLKFQIKIFKPID